MTEWFKPEWLRTYRVEFCVGVRYISVPITGQLLCEAEEDQKQGEYLTREVILMLVRGAQHKENIPLESHHRDWVALTGRPGIEGVIGPGYRTFTVNDFVQRSEVTAVCMVTLVPEDAIPKQCDRPGCREWAQYHYGLRLPDNEAPILGDYIWGKSIGDDVYACPPHARELLMQDTHYPPRIQDLHK